MAGKRRIAALGLLTLVASVLTWAAEIPAAEAACNFREQIFVRSTANRTNMNGTYNRIFFRERVMDLGCIGTSVALSTAHVEEEFTENFPNGNQVEIGWTERPFCLPTCVTAYFVFTEWEVDYNAIDYTEFDAVGDLVFDTYDQWKIDNPTGTNDWKLRVNFEDGTGFHLKKTYTTDYGNGVSLGETERFASGTGMKDDQLDLQYRNASDVWVVWPGMNCVQHVEENGTGTYSWNFNNSGQVSGNEYHVLTSNNACA